MKTYRLYTRQYFICGSWLRLKLQKAKRIKCFRRNFIRVINENWIYNCNILVLTYLSTHRHTALTNHLDFHSMRYNSRLFDEQALTLIENVKYALLKFTFEFFYRFVKFIGMTWNTCLTSSTKFMHKILRKNGRFYMNFSFSYFQIGTIIQPYYHEFIVRSPQNV